MELAPRNLSVPAVLFSAVASIVILQAACSSGSNGTTTGPSPSIALSVAPGSGSAPQGGSTSTVAGLTRKGGFHGNVTFSVEGAPAGVTATVGTPTTANDVTSVTVTIQVAASTVPGTYNLLLRGQGSGVTDATAPFALTVTAVVAPDYSLSLSQPALSVLQGGSAPSTVSITRVNFSDAVTLSLGNAPVGVTGAFAPPAPTGTTSTLTVTVGAGVPPGLYSLTVNGTGTPGARSTPLALTVTGPSGGTNVVLDYSGCPVDVALPIWLAVQDGTGPWTRVTPVGQVFSFTFSQPKAGVAVVTQEAGSNTVSVLYFTPGDLVLSTLQAGCGLPGPKTVNGTLAGLAGGNLANVSLGGERLEDLSSNGPFHFSNQPDGAFDLVSYSHPATSVTLADRMLLLRDLNIANNGSLGTVDLNGAAAFSPAFAAMTVTGVAGGETLAQSMNYFTGPGPSCVPGVLYSNIAFTGASFIAYGAPAAKQRATDVHSVSVVAELAGSEQRFIGESFHAMGPRTLALGPAMPTPVLTTLTGPYQRLQAAFAQPASYGSLVEFNYTDGATSNTADITASVAWIGGQAVSVSLPDFTGVAGWSNGFAPPAGHGSWFITGAGSTASTVNGLCQDGARFLSANRNGSY